jgi:hypothetical protein
MENPGYMQIDIGNFRNSHRRIDKRHHEKREAEPPQGSPARLGEEANTVVWFSDAVLKSDIQAEPCRGMILTLPDCHVSLGRKGHNRKSPIEDGLTGKAEP